MVALQASFAALPKATRGAVGVDPPSTMSPSSGEQHPLVVLPGIPLRRPRAAGQPAPALPLHKQNGLQIGRTSCCRFWANQLRVFFTAAAYVLMQELRLRAAGTACARTQVTWLRDRLLKLGAHVGASVRRIVLHLPTATPDLHAWRHIALALGARPG